MPSFLNAAQEYLRRSSPVGLLDLFTDDDEKRTFAVYDCWALGRTDARAFIFLRRALLDLTGDSLIQAIVLLSHLTPHPDILWHKGNWVPPAVEAEVKPVLRWSAEEVRHLVGAVEAQINEGASGWERGGLGQCLWHLLAEDPNLLNVARLAIGLAVSLGDLDAALRILILAQYRSADPVAEVKSALAQHPQLQAHEWALWLVQETETYGHLPVY